MKILFYLLLNSFFIFSCFCQEIIKIDTTIIEKHEFLKQYSKNNFDKSFSKNSLYEYADLYSLYILKIKEAKKIKYDTLVHINKEYKDYENQLINSYFIDKQYSNKFLNNQYLRSKEDRKIAHIFINCNFQNINSDTLVAYTKIQNVRNLLEKGSLFDSVAKKYNEDENSIKTNGELGYINIFMTHPDFEENVYNTPLNQYSDIFKTNNGYLIIKVLNIRPSRGRIKVQHIFITNNDPKSSEEKINQAYKDIVANKITFESAVTKFSEDKSTEKTEGNLEEFGINQMIIDFEDKCFELENPNDISKPFKTSYGWHIVKLNYKKNDLSKDTFKMLYKVLAEKDKRVVMKRENVLDSMKSKYNFKSIKTNIDAFISNIDSSIFEKQYWRLKSKKEYNLFSIDSKNYTSKDLEKYIEENIDNKTTSKFKNIFVEALINNYSNTVLTHHVKENLKSIDSNFSNTLKEYQNGLYVFEIMEKNIWDVAKNDSVGLQNYYNSNKTNYLTDTLANIARFYTNNLTQSNYIYNSLQNTMNSQTTLKNVNSKYDSSSTIYVDNKIEKGFNADLDKLLWKEKTVYKPIQLTKDKWLVVFIKDILPKEIKSYEKTKGKVINDYQKIIEINYYKKLKEYYNITINYTELNKLIK